MVNTTEAAVVLTGLAANGAAVDLNGAAADNGYPVATAAPAANVTPDGRAIVTTATINDPLFSAQWYLNNTGQRYTPAKPQPQDITLLDLNILPVWARGITGKGTVVAITDDGIDLNHEDLTNQLIKDKTYNPDSTIQDTGGNPITQGVGSYPPPAANTKDHQHGTVVGSIVGMEAQNGKGMVGVAFGTKLVSTISAGANFKTFDYLKGLTGLGSISGGVDVSVNSYGLDPAFSDNYYIAPNTPVGNYTDKQKEGEAIRLAATDGRGGKGIVIEVSAGNEASNRADPAMTNFTGSRFIIASGAVTELGFRTDYSTPGASVLVSAFGGVGAAKQDVNSGFGIPSADISGNLGYNTTSNTDNSYAYQSQGTSYSGPMVGATAALMLQANPNLGFRDVSTILAMTARKVGDTPIFVGQTANKYINNKATDWNLGGMHFSRDVGYGLIDVTAAVQLAESWTLPAGTAANWQPAVGVSTDPTNVTIPDNDPTAGLTVSASVTQNVRIERVEFELDLTATKPNQLRAVVTSAMGTEIELFDRPLASELVLQTPNDPESPKVAGPNITPWPGVFSIGSTAFLGESSAGTWTLKLFDTVTGDLAQYKSLTVRAWGSAITDDSQYVMTREFTGGQTLTDTAGVDVINAAALQSAVTIDLNQGATSTVVTGQTFTIANGSVIENVTGGSGGDTLVGNAANNLLRGNLGADMLTGGGGADTFYYFLAQDSTLTAFDTIQDFNLTDGDKLDVTSLDANTATAANDDFVFLGTNALVANGLRYQQTGGNTLVQADLDGNASTIEFQVTLVGSLALTDNHFMGVKNP